MPARPRFQTRQVGGVVGALLTALLGFALLNLNLPIGKKLVHLSYDLPFLVRPVEIHGDPELALLLFRHRSLPFSRRGQAQRPRLL